MKYRSIYFKTEQFSFPLLSVKKMFPSHSDLLMAFTYFPNCLPTAFGLVWVTPYSCLLRPSLNAEGQTRVTTRHTTTAQCHPRRRAIHAIYFTPHARACRHYHDYLKESQRGEVTCPGLHGCEQNTRMKRQPTSLTWHLFHKVHLPDFECNQIHFTGFYWTY